MKKLKHLLITCLLFLFSGLFFGQVVAIAQNAKISDGAILEQSAYAFPAYEQLPGWAKRIYTKETYAELSDSPKFELQKIKYSSDGLKVVGFIYKPKAATGKKLPVIFWNRGGIGEDTKIGNQSFQNIYEMYRLASAGFVVLASQYRGIDGGEGADEIGGADTRDVMNLLPLAKSLPYADTENMYIWGVSRGAMMALQAVRDGLPVKAAVVVSPPTDWNEMFSLHPELAEIAKKVWQHYDTRREESIKNRSAIFWADKINVPVLILGGSDDSSTPPQMALSLAQKLEEQGKFYELTIYARDDHGVIKNREDRLKRTIEWFQHTPRKSIAQTLLKTVREQNLDVAVKQYYDLKKTYPNLYDWSEGELNLLGYMLINNRKMKEAIGIFKLNTEVFPNSGDVYDSLGEAYMIVGDRDAAIKNYRRSLELNPQNTNAVEVLKKLESQPNKSN